MDVLVAILKKEQSIMRLYKDGRAKRISIQ